MLSKYLADKVSKITGLDFTVKEIRDNPCLAMTYKMPRDTNPRRPALHKDNLGVMFDMETYTCKLKTNNGTIEIPIIKTKDKSWEDYHAEILIWLHENKRLDI